MELVFQEPAEDALVQTESTQDSNKNEDQIGKKSKQVSQIFFRMKVMRSLAW